MMWRVALLLVGLMTAAAADCPETADTGEEQSRLTAALRSAHTAAEARAVQSQLWILWTLAPDVEAQELLDRGMAMRDYDLEGSRDALDTLVAYCPNFPEGYNQRAFTAFLRRDYGAALTDLETVLGMNPDHVPALTGLALTLMGLGRQEAAQGVLRDALSRNPFLAERALLTEPPGEEL